jgi:hypothetical protein
VPSAGAGRSGAVLVNAKALVRRSQEVRARARAIRQQIAQGRSQREVLHDSAFARLHARQETMVVIEQANVKLHVLAPGS